MHAFTVLADPVRRRIVEVLAAGERTAGELVTVVGGEFDISQSAISQQLRVLRDHGFARVRPAGARRVYALEPTAMHAVDRWLQGVSDFWSDRLDDLAAEVEVHPLRPLVPLAEEGATMPPGTTLARVVQVTRTVRDVAESETFYGTTLGLAHVGTSDGSALFDAGGMHLLLSQREPPAAHESVLTFAVESMVAAIERLEAAGVEFREPAQVVRRLDDGTREWLAHFEDPEGRPLAIVARRASSSVPKTKSTAVLSETS